MNKERALNILAHGYLLILQPDEGIVVFENDNPETAYVIIKTWHEKESRYNVDLYDLKDLVIPECYNKDELHDGTMIWLHADKESCVDAIIDEKNKEIK